MIISYNCFIKTPTTRESGQTEKSERKERSFRENRKKKRIICRSNAINKNGQYKM